MFSLQQNWKTRGQNRPCLEAREMEVGGGGRGWVGGKWGGEVAQTMCTHMNKYKKH
jgi:hypothetical protein